jgi:hypothetical protein
MAGWRVTGTVTIELPVDMVLHAGTSDIAWEHAMDHIFMRVETALGQDAQIIDDDIAIETFDHYDQLD